MNNRTNVDELLREIEQRNETLWNKDVKVNQLRGIAGVKNEYKHLGDMFALDSTRLAIFNRRFSNPVDDLPRLDILFSVLASVQRLKKIAPSEIRLYITSATLCLTHVVRFIGGYKEGDEKVTRYRQDFHDRINELPEDNIFRQVFVREYNHDSLYGVEERLMVEIIAEYKKIIDPAGQYSEEAYHNTSNGTFANDAFIKGILEEWNTQSLLSVTKYQDEKDYERFWKAGKQRSLIMSVVNGFCIRLKHYYDTLKKRIRRK